ncbi:hypothetical protein JCM21900_002232 [Sporobolomyces salmonicolor]
MPPPSHPPPASIFARSAPTRRLPCPVSSSLLPPRQNLFSTTPRHSARRPGAAGHLIHPVLRQRLTNLTFFLAAFFSIATVSLTMSGSLGGGAGMAPGCPARGRVGVGMDGDRAGHGEAERTGRGERDGSDRRGGKLKGFLEDPVVPAPGPVWRPASATGGLLRPAEEEGLGRREEGAAEGRIEAAVPATTSRRQEGGDGRAMGWRGWVGLSERVV